MKMKTQDKIKTGEVDLNELDNVFYMDDDTEQAFIVLHPEHLDSIMDCRAMGSDTIVVLVNDDDGVWIGGFDKKSEDDLSNDEDEDDRVLHLSKGV
jgi:hypothetical protein